MNLTKTSGFRFVLIGMILLLPSLAMAQSRGYRDWSGVFELMCVLLVLAAASTLVFPIGILITFRENIRSLKWSIFTLVIASLGGAAAVIAPLWFFPEAITDALPNLGSMYLGMGGVAAVVMSAITMAMYRIQVAHLEAQDSEPVPMQEGADNE